MRGRPWAIHGGRRTEACAAYGHPPAAWLDLSTGINPEPWPHGASIAPDWAALPDETALHDLETTAACHFGVDPAHVCAVPGSEMWSANALSRTRRRSFCCRSIMKPARKSPASIFGA